MTFSEVYAQHDFRAVSARIRDVTDADVRRALAKAGTRLELRDLEALLSPAATPHLEELAAASHRLTVQRFGRTIQLYAPLYLSNACANVCTYCGFSAENRIRRKTLDDAAIELEADALARMGFQHLLLVTGESGRVGTEYLARALTQLRPRFANLSLEVQPLLADDYRALRDAGASSVLVYQETYDAEEYAKHHLSGPKADMRFRLDTGDRLGEAGMHKVGLGALFGLSDWRSDAWFVGLHLRHLERAYFRTKLSVSFPRLRPHEGSVRPAHPFEERELVQAACALRLFAPEAELALSTRESAHFRSHAFRLGFTHMSAGSRTNPGGYAGGESLEQFSIDDTRSPAALVSDLARQGYAGVWKDWAPCFDGAG